VESGILLPQDQILAKNKAVHLRAANRRNGMVLVTFRAIPGENDGFSDNPSNTIPGPKYTRLASQMYHVPELSVGTCSYRVVDDVQ
jgi:hypothetical protein